MGVETFGTIAVKIDRFNKELTDDAVSHALGKMAKGEATAAASADLGGDPKFSGWAPSLDTRYDIIGPGRISFHPSKRSAGPWTVAQQGRNQGSASGFQGPGINASTGVTSFTNAGNVRKVRARKAKKWNGRTQGKGTASSALSAIDKKVGGVVDQQVKKAISHFFR
jgi:hypothetical protein